MKQVICSASRKQANQFQQRLKFIPRRRALRDGCGSVVGGALGAGSQTPPLLPTRRPVGSALAEGHRQRGLRAFEERSLEGESAM